MLSRILVQLLLTLSALHAQFPTQVSFGDGFLYKELNSELFAKILQYQTKGNLIAVVTTDKTLTVLTNTGDVIAKLSTTALVGQIPLFRNGVWYTHQIQFDRTNQYLYFTTLTSEIKSKAMYRWKFRTNDQPQKIFDSESKFGTFTMYEGGWSSGPAFVADRIFLPMTPIFDNAKYPGIFELIMGMDKVQNIVSIISPDGRFPGLQIVGTEKMLYSSIGDSLVEIDPFSRKMQEVRKFNSNMVNIFIHDTHYDEVLLASRSVDNQGFDVRTFKDNRAIYEHGKYWPRSGMVQSNGMRVTQYWDQQIPPGTNPFPYPDGIGIEVDSNKWVSLISKKMMGILINNAPAAFPHNVIVFTSVGGISVWPVIIRSVRVDMNTLTLEGHNLLADPEATILVNGISWAISSRCSNCLSSGFDQLRAVAPYFSGGKMEIKLGGRVGSLNTIEISATSAVNTKLVHGASFEEGKLSPGMIASFFGSGANFGTTEVSGRNARFSLGGAEMRVCGLLTRLFYNSGDGQINFLVPRDVSTPQRCEVEVKAGNVSVKTTVFIDDPPTPALFTFLSRRRANGELDPASTLPVVTHTDYSLVGTDKDADPTSPTSEGEVVILWGTGFGRTFPEVKDESEAPPDGSARCFDTPIVKIGGVKAEVLYCLLAPNFSGLNQVAVRVPLGTISGANHMWIGEEPISPVYTLWTK